MQKYREEREGEGRERETVREGVYCGIINIYMYIYIYIPLAISAND
jgi:hypothetical protein